MARGDGIDRTSARNMRLTTPKLSNAQQHNEREKDSYVNQDIVPERSHLNVHFKTPTGDYLNMFQQMEADGVISTRGIKEDAFRYGELIFDVNSAYFFNHGGYDFAKQFYVLKTSAIFEGAFLLEESKEVVAEDYYRVSCPIEANTLLVSRMNTPKLVGACALCDVTLPNVFLPDRLWKVVLKKNVDPRWLNYVISSESSQRSIRRKAGGTSNSMKNISQKDFLDIPIVLPSYDEQVSIANIIAAVDEVIKKLYEEIGMWGNKKRALMQMLLTGIVRVKV